MPEFWMEKHLSLSKWRTYGRLMRLDKPIGALLLLWPTCWALWLAAMAMPPLNVLIVFVLGVVVMRAAGCVINDYADRHIDGHVKRTQQRPMAIGAVTGREAKIIFLILIFFALLLVLTLNRLTILLSFAGLALASCYPFMKRYTYFPQVVLGAAYSWAIPMAWAAVCGTLPAACWLLFTANICWTVAYDTQYAMVDRDDDLKIAVKSTAILFGHSDTLIIGLLQVATLLLLALAGIMLDVNRFYYVGILAAGGLFIYQQRLISDRERDACFQAFLNNNYVGAIMFVAVALGISAF